MKRSVDSIRVYFNKGKADERYVTYKGRAFKPRDLRNPDEYRFERIIGSRKSHAEGMFYYTFTNEDYENAIENQNATPIPIRRCHVIKVPGGYKNTEPSCMKEGSTVCY